MILKLNMIKGPLSGFFLIQRMTTGKPPVVIIYAHLLNGICHGATVGSSAAIATASVFPIPFPCDKYTIFRCEKMKDS